MIIVLIHWRIKPTDIAEREFFEHWCNKAKIDDKTGLGGEFLSAPIPASQLPFRTDDLTFGHGLLDCRHFINVGMWKDWESFYEQVGKLMSDDKPLLPFEADRRTRTILEPKTQRIGGWQFPTSGTCE